MKPTVIYIFALVVMTATAFFTPSRIGVARTPQPVEQILHVADTPHKDSIEAQEVLKKAAELTERLDDKSKELNKVIEKSQQKSQEIAKDAATLREVIAEKKDNDKVASESLIVPAGATASDTVKQTARMPWFRRIFR